MNRRKMRIAYCLILLCPVLSSHTYKRDRPYNPGYFYFELTSSIPGKPYYFSQVVALTYIDGKDLRAQQDSCVKLLRAAAGTPDNYNDTGSTESTSSDDSNKERASNIAHLQGAGETVIEKRI